MNRRHAGIILPLFSARSTASWGIGELTDLVPLSRWMTRASLDRLMVLPLGTMKDEETSPYSTTSTLAIDPIYIATEQVPEFQHAGGIGRLSADARHILDTVRRPGPVHHARVRRLKDEALAIAFDLFAAEEWAQLTTRASAFAAYIARERSWLDDYALFRAISVSMPGVSWQEWPPGLRDRDPQVLDRVRRDLQRQVMREQYAQWLADTQWRAARAEASRQGVEVIGDMPFVAATESADVWARSAEFLLDVSVGCPPDAFSATGQDWGLPAYQWEAIALTGYAWMRLRAQRMAALYAGLRVDHLVGLYRTYGRPQDGVPRFMPAEPSAQLIQGEAVLDVVRASGLEIIAEDLGEVPEFVRESLARLGVPGTKVLRWERDYHTPSMPFLEPTHYPAASAAMTGTHDTESLAEWWETTASAADRIAFLDLAFFRARRITDADPYWSDGLRDLVIELAYRAGSDHLFLPVPDIFGWRDRINVPGTIGAHNWTWTLPWPVDWLDETPQAQERAEFLRRLAGATGRGGAQGL